ncbi:MAG: hypothetical protein PHU43_10000, partial [Candidatus Bipolaricaulis sp.]|nr:hypothetical protein [Candidatus Bipolaricaulis sp.]
SHLHHSHWIDAKEGAKPIANLYEYYEGESEANARLIAAAPDLYQACRLAMSVLAVEYENGTGKLDASKALHAFGNLKYAVARADGEEV